ncbi:MAG: hypothetical protein L0219_13430 [Phycisphaerales bacterium]|nr:hypothetical protein [Phycisphaerales bacterium]MCI0677324.1 hypothetical protein [Phycisphaerales bacterium]
MTHINELSLIHPSVCRRGTVLRSLLMVTCGGTFLAGAAFVLDPLTLQAVSKPPESSQTAPQRRREFVDHLARLIGGCVAVLAVHDRGDTPNSQIVLWVDDRTNPGVIDAPELAIVSQSQLFQTITLYTMTAGSPGRLFESAASTRPIERDAPLSWDITGQYVQSRAETKDTYGLEEVGQATFCDRWRALPSVVPHIIGTGISDMRVERLSKSPAELSPLRILLRWGLDSTDGAWEASTVIDLNPRKRHSGAQEQKP